MARAVNSLPHRVIWTTCHFERRPTATKRKDREMGITEGPWEWQIHDHSMASLGSGDSPGYGTPHVLSVSPYKRCQDRSGGKWEWGRCLTPSEDDARLIAAAPDLLAACQEFCRKVDAGEAKSNRSYQQMSAAIKKATI